MADVAALAASPAFNETVQELIEATTDPIVQVRVDKHLGGLKFFEASTSLAFV